MVFILFYDHSIFFLISCTNLLTILLWPISTNSTSLPTVMTEPANWTGLVRCRTNPSRISSSFWQTWLSMFLTMLACGCANLTPDRNSRYGATIGFRREQWKAAETGSNKAVIFSYLNLVLVCSSALVLPARLTLLSVLKQANYSPSSPATCSTLPLFSSPAYQHPVLYLTIIIPLPSPPRPQSSISWPRLRTTFRQVPRSILLAMHRAEYSPMLWPIRQSWGSRGTECRYLKCSTWDRTSIGWVMEVRLSNSGWHLEMEVKSRPSCEEYLSIQALAAGIYRSRSSMPSYWVPWPAKMQSRGARDAKEQ